MRAALQGRIPMDLPFDTEQPWNGVFMQVSIYIYISLDS